MSSRRGLLFVVSAPSGAGKTTLVRELVKRVPGLRMSRSYTSRPIRNGEQEGVDYNYVSVERFLQMREAGDFLEWAEVFGNYYGTSFGDTECRLAAGDDLVLVIDVQGAAKVRARGIPFVGIFVLPPSMEMLESRLRKRSRDPEEQLARRLETARREIHSISDYGYVVINDDLESAVDRLRAIVLAERCRREAMDEEVRGITRSFGRR
jgi:guanylate kinase